jgi:Ca2+-binding EF-hand superfamily protein
VLKTGLLLILVLAWTATAHAQPEPKKEAAPQPRPSAAAGSSALRPEDREAARELFRELDRNGDGYLTPDELWSERGREGNWAAVDRDRDGRIAPSEFTTLPSR